MINRFKDYIKSEELFTEKEKILLTVSGGIDSMTMLMLFIKAGYCFEIAHCNFQLRGEESDGDQQFVESFARNNSLKIHIKSFDTKAFAAENNISIQMAARELRYNWFNELSEKYGFDKVATAHNLNDVVETFFINLTRGTGIKGLTGIKPKNGNLIRPLLFAKREEIEDYAKSNKLDWREDSSNAETKYLRNAIRHKIIPEFEKLNPSFLDSVMHSTNILKESEKVYFKRLIEIKNDLLRTENNSIYITKDSLLRNQVNPTILFEILNEYGFTLDNAIRIIENLDGQPGKVFYSQNFQLLIDRTDLIISKQGKSAKQEFLIEENQQNINAPVKLKFSHTNADNFKLIKAKNVASFDAEKLDFPLKLRRWQHGDYFYPFGLNGRKKISDFFTDKKLSLIDKENTWMLVSGENIIWIIGYRTDDRFKITKATKKVIQFELID